MIANIFLNIVVLIIGAIFSWLPVVTSLPTINGFDIDSALVTGIGQLNTFLNTFWPIKYMIVGALTIFSYYILKMGLKFILGHRAPGQH